VIAIPDFQRCKEEANRLLLQQKKLDVHFDIRQLRFADKRIVFDSLQNYAAITGMPLNILLHDRNSPIRDGVRIYSAENDLHLILYNEDISRTERLRFTLAHEVGHVILNHIEECETAELEADHFAAQLLAPWFTITMLGNVTRPTAEQLSVIFGISVSAANRRISEVYRNRHSLSETDKKVYDLQKDQAHKLYNATHHRKTTYSMAVVTI